MVLLEIATLGVAAFGLMDYRHTKIYQANIYNLKRKYGEHPNIDEAFDDICKAGGEEFIKPWLDLKSDNPQIHRGSCFTSKGEIVMRILNNFFLTDEEKMYFYKKYDDEHNRQLDMKAKILKEMYYEVEPKYKNGEFKNIGKKRIKSRIYKGVPIVAAHEEHLKEITDKMIKDTIWGEIFEAGPNITQIDMFKYDTEWYIKEEIFNEIKYKEAYDILFESAYRYVTG